MHDGLDIKTHICSKCTKAFGHKSYLNRHIKTIHDGIKKEKCFHCQECEKSFINKSHLNSHVLAVHRGERPYKCSRCAKAFGQKTYLNRHEKIVHEGIKNSHLPNKSFGRPSELDKHARKHND